jgi:endo-1,4-beta-mannosidase
MYLIIGTRYGGVDEFAAFRGLQHNDFFYDANLRADFKALISKVLNRVNTVNKRVYKDDPTILAWQLGNELCLSPNRDSVPVSWSTEMADYIRSLDANHLIMDGTW